MYNPELKYLHNEFDFKKKRLCLITSSNKRESIIIINKYELALIKCMFFS